MNISPLSIRSRAVFGRPRIVLYIVPSGISSLEAFGSHEVKTTIHPESISSSFTSGQQTFIVEKIVVTVPSEELNYGRNPPLETESILGPYREIGISV
jgi:hypothetical protein